MSEALILLEDDDDEGPHPATTNAVATYVRDALGNLKHVVSTGNKDADADLLIAEQALRQALNKLS